LSIQELDYLLQYIIKQDSRFPLDDLNELRNLEVLIEKKEEELRNHQANVSG